MEVRRRDAFEKEIAAGFVLGAVLAVLYAIGFALRIEYWWIDPSIPIYIVGSTMTTLALWVWRGLRAESWASESEKFDTVEDH